MQSFVQTLIASAGDIVIDIQRRVISAVAQQEARLMVETLQFGDIDGFAAPACNGAQGKVKAGVVALDITFDQLRHQSGA